MTMPHMDELLLYTFLRLYTEHPLQYSMLTAYKFNAVTARCERWGIATNSMKKICGAAERGE